MSGARGLGLLRDKVRRLGEGKGCTMRYTATENNLNLPYPDAGGQVVENGGFQREGLPTHYRVGHGELDKEGLEGSEGHCRGQAKARVCRSTECIGFPLGDGVRDGHF